MAGWNETHEQITDVGSVFDLAEEGIFLMQEEKREFNLLCREVVGLKLPYKKDNS